MNNLGSKFNMKNLERIIDLIIFKIENIAPDKGIRGRPNKVGNRTTLELVLFLLSSGITWDNLDCILKILKQDFTADCIRKKFNNWIIMNIFDDIRDVLIDDYISKINIDELELTFDSTDVINVNGLKEDCGFGRKNKNKNAQKTSILGTQHGIPLCQDTCGANEAEVRQLDKVFDKMPPQIINNFSYNRTMTVTTDAGYHAKYPHRQAIRAKYHVYLNVANKRNMTRYISDDNKELLKKRYHIEHINKTLKRTYKHFNRITDREAYRLETNFNIYTCCMIALFYNTKNFTFDNVYNLLLGN